MIVPRGSELMTKYNSETVPKVEYTEETPTYLDR
jgi:hypothetical protein